MTEPEKSDPQSMHPQRGSFWISLFAGDAGRVRLGTLTLLRWLAVAGQVAAIVIVHFGLDYNLPLLACLGAVGASIILNILVVLIWPQSRRLTDAETTLYIAFDQLQLAALLYFTGGLENPFAILFIAPATIAASSLNLRNTLALGFFTFSLITLLAVFHYPLPWDGDVVFALPPLYLAGLWIALVFGLGFTTIVAFRVASEATRMSAALAATQIVLAREEKLAALGSLAAAAAHELGTPLGTIAVVARELARELPPNGAMSDDARLLIAEVERCRKILSEIAHHDEASDEGPLSRSALPVLLDDLAQPFRGASVAVRVIADGDRAPIVRRSPELRHALTSLIENACDFAQSDVEIRADWDTGQIRIAIVDDGPGFAPGIIQRLGEPYVTTRPGISAPRDEDLGPAEPHATHEGMGLGFFIAKTLLERTGASLACFNRGQGGAAVHLSWPRGRIDPE